MQDADQSRQSGSQGSGGMGSGKQSGTRDQETDSGRQGQKDDASRQSGTPGSGSPAPSRENSKGPDDKSR